MFLFILADLQVEQALSRLSVEATRALKNVIVYCATLAAHCSLTKLLNAGIPASCITLVKPPSMERGTTTTDAAFGDAKIASRVQKMIEQLGIRIVDDGKIVQIGQASGYICEVRAIV